MMQYNKVSKEQINDFNRILGEAFVISGREQTEEYSHDHTEDLKFYPEIVLKPETAEQISAILKICNANYIPVTPRGAGTGLSGGALPIHGGVVISMERFNKICMIDEKNFQATVEPGVINENFQVAVKEKILFYKNSQALEKQRKHNFELAKATLNWERESKKLLSVIA